MGVCELLVVINLVLSTILGSRYLGLAIQPYPIFLPPIA